jgi:hypothetical protein
VPSAKLRSLLSDEEVDMTEPATCGQGLAANAALPAKLGELTAALAAVLESHTKALDLDDENARRERDLYLRLVEEQRRAASQLEAAAERMTGSRDLPIARHLSDVLASPEAAAPFQRFVEVEEELLALLRERLDEERAMLGEMGGGA